MNQHATATGSNAFHLPMRSTSVRDLVSSPDGNLLAVAGDDAFEGYRKDLDDAERKVAGEIDPGVRAMVRPARISACMRA